MMIGMSYFSRVSLTPFYFMPPVKDDIADDALPRFITLFYSTRCWFAPACFFSSAPPLAKNRAGRWWFLCGQVGVHERYIFAGRREMTRHIAQAAAENIWHLHAARPFISRYASIGAASVLYATSHNNLMFWLHSRFLHVWWRSTAYNYEIRCIEKLLILSRALMKFYADARRRLIWLTIFSISPAAFTLFTLRPFATIPILMPFLSPLLRFLRSPCPSFSSLLPILPRHPLSPHFRAANDADFRYGDEALLWRAYFISAA